MISFKDKQSIIAEAEHIYSTTGLHAAMEFVIEATEVVVCNAVAVDAVLAAQTEDALAEADAVMASAKDLLKEMGRG